MKGNGPSGPDESMRSGTAAKVSPGKATPVDESTKSAAIDDSNIGSALRSVYQQTINEDIPAEMLDLLNKLT